jgi:hypothetical protein
MFKAATFKLLVIATLIFGSTFSANTAPLTLFNSEGQAQQHCPSDVVVWLNLPTHIYHWKGMRWYETHYATFLPKQIHHSNTSEDLMRNDDALVTAAPDVFTDWNRGNETSEKGIERMSRIVRSEYWSVNENDL